MNAIRSMDYKAYREEPGVSKSMLDSIAPPPIWAGCPELYHAKHIARTVEDEDTDAKRFGSLSHRVLLEPDTLNGSCHIRPEGMVFTTKEGKAWRDEHSDRPIVTHDEWTNALGVRDAIWRHKDARRLLKDAQCEKSLFAVDSHSALRKARFDALPPGGDTLPDVKVCLSAALPNFESSSLKYRWFVQAAYYLDIAKLLGLGFEKFAFIVAEKTPPYLVAVYQVDPEVLDWGRRFYQRDLAQLAHCMETGIWPGYPTQMAGLPSWAKKQMEGVE